MRKIIPVTSVASMPVTVEVHRTKKIVMMLKDGSKIDLTDRKPLLEMRNGEQVVSYELGAE